MQSSASIPEGTQFPLCERPPVSVALLQAVLDWRQAAFQDIAAATSSWVQTDDPSQEDLQVQYFAKLYANESVQCLLGHQAISELECKQLLLESPWLTQQHPCTS